MVSPENIGSGSLYDLARTDACRSSSRKSQSEILIESSNDHTQIGIGRTVLIMGAKCLSW